MAGAHVDSIVAATRDYESWLRRQTPVVEADLRFKHVAMASGEFAFLRATFYRWCQLWSLRAGELTEAPRVLAVGDLHVENFGTWRDAEGRLVWGINDVDEASSMAYTNDLVRLATSARLAIAAGRLAISKAEACELLLAGYSEALRTGGRPFILDWKHPGLRAHAVGEQRQPVVFWAQLERLPVIRGQLPAGLKQRLRRSLPAGHGEVRYCRRRAGIGSLGHQRVVALSNLSGGPVAREAKALVASAMVWAGAGNVRSGLDDGDLLRRAVRCPDPHFLVDGRWVLRRLAPDCSRIDLDARLSLDHQRELLRAMGSETGNLHLGSRGVRRVLRDLERRSPDWLNRASRLMARTVASDFAEWAAWRRRASSGRVGLAQKP